MEHAFGALRLLELRAPCRGAAGDVPVVDADNGNRPLFAWVPSVLFTGAAPEVAEPTPTSEGPVRETMLFDTRR